MKRLTDLGVKRLNPRKERYDTCFGDGLWLRVYPTGRKQFQYVYRMDGRKRRFNLGVYDPIHLTVSDAKTAHGKARALRNANIDPKVERDTRRSHEKASMEAYQLAVTVKDLAKLYIDQWAKPRKKSWKEDERLLNKDVVTTMGSIKAAEVSRAQVAAMLSKVAKRAPITANRTLAVVRRMFNFAIEQGLLEYSPADRIKAPTKELLRHRVLNKEEIKSLWKRLDDKELNKSHVGAVRLALITGQRRGEVASMRWSEIQDDCWTIPGSSTKNGLTHRVPLSKLANEYLPKQSKGKVFDVNPDTLTHLVVNLRGKSDYTFHDLRRTVATSLAEMGFSHEIQNKLTNHKETGIAGRYDAYKYDKEKRQALDAWARRLESILEEKEDNNVLELARG